jgi:hypothetical protein
VRNHFGVSCRDKVNPVEQPLVSPGWSLRAGKCLAL